MKKETFPVVLAIICACFAAYLWSASFQESAVTPDTGYTLPMAERIAEGKVLFRDLGVQHTSFVLFILAGVSRLSGLAAQYSSYMGLLYFVSLVVLVLIAGLIRAVGVSKEYLAFLVGLSALGLYGAEGWTINFEPFVLLFGLTSHLLLLQAGERKSYYIFSGFLAGLAFIAKQYGVFILLSSLLTILTRRENFYKRIGDCLFLGFAFLAVSFAYLSYLASGAPGGYQEVFDAFSGRWYAKEPGSFLTFLWMAISISPFIVFVPFAVRPREYLENDALRLSLFAFCLSLLQGFVRQYFHYYIHCLPYAMALSAALATKPLGARVKAFALTAGVVAVCASAAFQYKGSGSGEAVRSNQMSLARAVAKKVPSGSKVLLLGPPMFMYLCHFLPVDNHIPGYNFLHNYSPEEMRTMLRKAEYIVIWAGSSEHYKTLVSDYAEKGFDLPKEIAELGYEQQSQVIHNRSRIVMASILKRPAGAAVGS